MSVDWLSTGGSATSCNGAKMRFKSAFLLCCFCLLTSCSRQPPPGDAGGDSGSAPSYGKALLCSVHTRVTIGKPFGIEIEEPQAVRAKNEPQGRGLSNAQRPSSTSLDSISFLSQDDLTFEPESLTLAPGQKKQIIAVLKSSQTGLASFSSSGTASDSCSQTIDAGFLGHLKMQPARLRYNTPQIMTVDVVDNSGSPLPLNVPLFLYLQTGDGFLTNRSVANGRDRSPTPGYAEAVANISTNASSSSQFGFTSSNIWGQTVHLRVIATTAPGRQGLTEGNFTFEADPAWWIPISLAIGGGLLYGMYSLAQDAELPNHWKRAVPIQIVTAIVAGLLAYLTANLDLLGLKLDPSLLRTYPLLGFLFSYIGIDRVFARQTSINQRNGN